MATRLFEIKLDATQVQELANRIGSFDGERLGTAIVSALNEVANDTYDLSRKHITNGVNLEDGYVKRRMQVREAKVSRPTAEIIAMGGFETNISHYGAMLDPALVNYTNDKILAMGKKFSKWPGWTYRKGDEARGIPEDFKQDKARAQVVRNRTKSIGRKFTLPGKNDSSGNPLIFRRNETGQIEGVLGPSVYQLFRVAAEELFERAGEDLENAIIQTAEREFLKAVR